MIRCSCMSDETRLAARHTAKLTPAQVERSHIPAYSLSENVTILIIIIIISIY